MINGILISIYFYIVQNQIFAKCGQCQILRKRLLEIRKCQPSLDALKEEREKHKALYMYVLYFYLDLINRACGLDRKI